MQNIYSEKYFDTSSYSPELINQIGVADATEHEQSNRRNKTTSEVQSWSQWGIHPTARDGQPCNLLEVGGGCGYLQEAAQNAGWSTLGLEISPHGIKRSSSRQLHIIPYSLEDFYDEYNPKPQQFDLIVFFDFLEHIADPGRALRIIHSLLRGDGAIILRVPCIEENEIPLYHLIDHVFHFSYQTIHSLLSKEGFSVSNSRHSGRFPGDKGQIQNITILGTKKE